MARRGDHAATMALPWFFPGGSRKRSSADGVALAIVVILALVGLVMVFSASAVLANTRYHDSIYFLKRHVLWLAMGFLAMHVALRMDYMAWRKLALPLLGYREAAWHLMRHWDFEPRCEIIWDKSWIGGGEWVRWQHEYLLVGKRGRPQWRARDIPSVYREQRDHKRPGQKPAYFRELIGRVSPAPRVELFGRHETPGWDVLGNAVDWWAGAFANCQQCGNPFPRRRSDAKYCSSACRQRAFHVTAKASQNGNSEALSVTQ